MAEFLETIDRIRAEEATIQRLFGGEGKQVRVARHSPRYMHKLAEAARMVADVHQGRRPLYHMQEAMTTSDFPLLFGDILDRQLLAVYRETVPTWRNFVHVSRVRDFRTVKRFSVYGADNVLDTVLENQEYPIAPMNENDPYTYAVVKHGRKVPYSWETLINDDLGAFADTPDRLGRAARRSEGKFVTQMYVDANGPHASFYTVGNNNIVTGNPALSITALQTAMAVLGAQVDENGEPILIETFELVVPPALEVVAENILNAVQLWLDTNASAGTAQQNLVTTNWMKARMRLSIDPYIPIVASSANGNTSWFLFANPDSGRPALEIGFLVGHEEPEIFMKLPNAVRVGGGTDAMSGDFDTDSIEYKIRHVFGGARMDPKMTVASQGDGS
jgi:hypothetical protein